MVPLGLLGPLSPEWFKEHKVVGCPHPHVPSGKFTYVSDRFFPSMRPKSNVSTLMLILYVSDHFPLLVELEMTPTVGTSNGLISRR